MNIRTRLTLLFTGLTGAILLVFVLVIYFSAGADRETTFFRALENEAVTKALLFLQAQVPPETLHSIYRNNREILREVEAAVYDTALTLLYHDAVDLDFVKETPDLLMAVYRQGRITFYQDKWQVVGIRHTYAVRDHLVTAAAYDEYGYDKLSNLLRNSSATFAGCILLIFAAGRLFSEKALSPVQDMTRQARQISVNHLHVRLPSGPRPDELSDLAATFNGMLDRLEHAFEAQKQFVSNISHEIRTPLAAMTTELELALEHAATPQQYRESILLARQDIHRLARLTPTLLDLAKTDYDPAEIAFKPLRIDETALEASLEAIRQNPEFQTQLHFDEDCLKTYSGDWLIVGNTYLLRVAFANLFENGCKFSPDQKCRCTLSAAAGEALLQFENKGRGIEPQDLDQIFQPFFRGENSKHVYGSGIGLSLVKKIIHLHGGNISVRSAPCEGAVFTVRLKLSSSRP